jgi:viroplasmin and RNaseH domain-containing protein
MTWINYHDVDDEIVRRFGWFGLSVAMASSQPNNCYAVACGRQCGIFSTWAETQPLVSGYSGAVFHKFGRRQDAELFLMEHKMTTFHLSPHTEQKSTSQPRKLQTPLPISNACPDCVVLEAKLESLKKEVDFLKSEVETLKQVFTLVFSEQKKINENNTF